VRNLKAGRRTHRAWEPAGGSRGPGRTSRGEDRQRVIDAAGRGEGRKRILTIAKTLQLIFPSRRKTREGGRQDGRRRAKERHGHSCAKYPPTPLPCPPIPVMQEARRLPFDSSGMFAPSVPAAPDGHRPTRPSL